MLKPPPPPKTGFQRLLIGTCRLKNALWVHGSLVAHVHGPPHSSEGEFSCRPLAQ